MIKKTLAIYFILRFFVITIIIIHILIIIGKIFSFLYFSIICNLFYKIDLPTPLEIIILLFIFSAEY